MSHRGCRRMAAALVSLACLLSCSACGYAQPQATRERRATQPAQKKVTVKDGRKLQETLNAARPGDEIVLDAGAAFTGNFTLPAKDGWVTLTSSRCAEITPGQYGIDPESEPLTARIETPNVGPALSAPPRSRNWRLQCLTITQNRAVGEYGYALVQLGDGSREGTQKTRADAPGPFEFDRVIIRARDDRTQVQGGITLNSADTTIRNSRISGIKWRGVQTYGIGGWNGPGPFRIENTTVEAAGLNFIFGGSTPQIPDLVPSDITIRNVHAYKPLAWKGVWTAVNLLELKNARHVSITNSLFENSWPDAQVGWAVIFNTFRDGGWEVVEDVTFSGNTVRNMTNGINLRGLDDGDTAVRMKRVRIADNRLEGLGSFGEEGKAFQLLQGSEDVVIDHNTVTGRVTHALVLDSTGSNKHLRLRFTNNLVPHGLYGVFSNGGALGAAAMDARAKEWQMEKNALIATTSELRGKYPRNYFPASAEQGAALKGTDNLPVGVRAESVAAPRPNRDD
jgi:hypothetical protein